MRVIIKPAGLLCILGAFLALTVISFWRYKTVEGNKGTSGAASAAARVAASAAAAKASPGTTSPGARTSPPPAAAPSVKKPLPRGVLLAPDISSENWKSLTTAGESTWAIVDATVPGHPRARRIAITKIGEKHWDLQLAHTLDAAFQKGQNIRLTYWARSKDSCPMAATVEQSEEPYSKIVYREEKLTPEWKQYSIEWEQPSDTPSGWAKVDFQMGYKVGVIELTGVIIRLADGK